MGRQRVLARSFPLARVAGDIAVVIFALALMWGGAVVALLAAKVAPATVDSVSGYRTAYDYLASLQTTDIGSSTRLIAAIAGLSAAVIFGYIAWRAIPRPYLARTDLRLSSDERGVVDVNPRAIERAAETGALELPAVAAARARFGTDNLTVDISADRADEVAATLQSVQQRVRDGLARHELPPLPVNITLVRLERKTRRELQ